MSRLYTILIVLFLLTVFGVSLFSFGYLLAKGGVTISAVL